MIRFATRTTALRALALATTLSFSAVAIPHAQTTTTVPETREQLRFSFAPVVKRVAPAVVNIRLRSQAQAQAQNPLYQDPFYRRFFGEDEGQRERSEQQPRAVGSGVIVRPDGVIVTNHHVVRNGGQIDVILADKRTFTAKVLLSDERTDLAILKIDTKGEKLTFMELRDSDEIEVGDFVLAIGNPFGVGQTVTSGIISAIARTSVNISDFRSFIQTDAPINPGNSGGALVSLDGKLVGINSAIISRSGGSVGIGFAIPSNMVGAVVRAALEGDGKLQRPTLGIGGQDVTPDIARARGINKIGGVIVSQVRAESPAAAAGIKVGDVILKINGREIADIQDLRFRLATLPVGGTVKLVLLRDNKESEIDVPLRASSALSGAAVTTLAGQHPLAGAQVARLTAEIGEELGIRASQGIVIAKIVAGSFAQRNGFRDGDVLLQVNGVGLESVDVLNEVLSQSGGLWRIVWRRSGQNMVRLFRGSVQ